LLHRWPNRRGIEEIARIEQLIPQKFKGAAMNLIGTRLERNGNDRHALPIFR
jgi:hypothetical protein